MFAAPCQGLKSDRGRRRDNKQRTYLDGQECAIRKLWVLREEAGQKVKVGLRRVHAVELGGVDEELLVGGDEADGSLDDLKRLLVGSWRRGPG